MSPDPAPIERFKAYLPLLFLVLVVALIPPLGLFLVGAGVIGSWARKARGTWPWEGRFWDEMLWTVAGAVAIAALGLLINHYLLPSVVSVVRSLFA